MTYDQANHLLFFLCGGAIGLGIGVVLGARQSPERANAREAGALAVTAGLALLVLVLLDATPPHAG